MKFYHRGVIKHGRGNQCLKQTVFEYETMNVKKDEDLSRVLKCKQIKKDILELSSKPLKRAKGSTVFEHETMNVKKDEDRSRLLKCKQIKKDVQELSCKPLKRKAQQIRYRIQSK